MGSIPFGQFQNVSFKRHAISSLSEFETVVNGSACVNLEQLVSMEDGTTFVPVGDLLKSFLQALHWHQEIPAPRVVISVQSLEITVMIIYKWH